MEDFISISKPLEMREYLSNLEEPKRSEVAWLLNESLPVLEHLNRKYSYDALPEIRIITSPTIAAEATSYVIHINSGLIDHILHPYPASPQAIISSRIPAVFGNGNISALMSMIWILSHEWIHIIRRHDELRHHIEITPEISQALEYDADLCGLAEVYRRIQHIFGKFISDIEIRQYSAYSVFWPIRTLPAYRQSSTHGSHAERLFHMFHKLVILGERHTDPVDADVAKPETLQRSTPILETLFKCEDAYITSDHPKTNEDDLRAAWARLLTTNEHMRTVDAWHSISPLVSRLSKTKTTEPKFTASSPAKKKKPTAKQKTRNKNRLQAKARAKNRKK